MRSTGFQSSQKVGDQSTRQAVCGISSRYKLCKFRSEGLFSSGWGWTKLPAEVSSSEFEFLREGDCEEEEAGEADVPEILKCPICASWAVSKGLAPFSIFFCKQKQHRDSRALLADLKKELEHYIGILGTTIVDSKIQFAVNFMFKNAIRADSESFCESVYGARILPPAPTFDSETGVQVSCQDMKMCSESLGSDWSFNLGPGENKIYH